MKQQGNLNLRCKIYQYFLICQTIKKFLIINKLQQRYLYKTVSDPIKLDKYSLYQPKINLAYITMHLAR